MHHMKITVVRHGQTTGNIGHIVESRVGGVLTEKGIEQARLTAEKLKDEVFDVVYSSDKQRCIDTAQYILQYHDGTPLIPRSDITELDKGKYDGGTWEDLPDYINTDTYISTKLEGGESWMDVHARVLSFLKEIYSTEQSNVLIVTHDGVLKVMHAILDDVPMVQAIKRYHENAHPYVWDMDGVFLTESMK